MLKSEAFNQSNVIVTGVIVVASVTLVIANTTPESPATNVLPRILLIVLILIDVAVSKSVVT